jgi:HD superfamily phosphodiesterase
LQRLRNAFPNLNRYIEKNINNEIKDKISMLLTTVQRKIISNMMERKPLEAEFYRVIRDIYGHGEFLKLKQYYHHNSSIYDHVNEVAYLSYRICKYLKLDYRSATRGALLHDFFLYNWHDHDEPDLPRDKNHGIAHPRIALANAEKHFSLNDIERDIIKKHMWPLTLVPPRYKESFVVSFADKYLSSKEYIDEFKKNRVRRRVARPRKIRRTKKKLKAL